MVVVTQEWLTEPGYWQGVLFADTSGQLHTDGWAHGVPMMCKLAQMLNKQTNAMTTFQDFKYKELS